MRFLVVPRRGRAHRLALAVGGVLAALWLFPPPASAHASLVSTDPAEGVVLAEAPKQISLTFDEPVSLAASATRLYDAQGQPVSADARSVDRAVTVTPAE